MQLSNSLTPRSIASSNYLLRKYGGAAAAYSLQRLDTSTDNVVRARESVGDTEADFTAEEVSGGALREFALQNDADLIRFANQSAATDKRMYFDGSNDYVDTGYQADATSDFFVSAKFVLDASYVPNDTIFSDVGGSERLVQLFVNNTGQLQANVDSSAGVQVVCIGSTTINAGVVYAIRMEHTASTSTLDIYLNDVLEATGTYSGTFNTANYGSIVIGAWPNNTQHWNGIIYDVNFNDESTYNGYGNTDADWEDQVGSNDGTVNGSPALFSGQGFDAFVTTWYDQSGNGRNATQATAASQPQIVADGVVVTDANGNAAISFDGVNDKLGVAGEIIISGDNTASWSGFSVQEIATTDLGFVYGNTAGGGVGTALRPVTGPTAYTISSATTTADYIARTAAALPDLVSTCYNNGDAALRLNGGGTPVSGSYTYGVATLDFTIGDWPSSPVTNSALLGKISEVVVYDGVDKSSDRTAIESNIANRYGITLA